MNAADRRRLTPTLGIVAAILLLALIALWLGAGRRVHWRDDAAPPRLPAATPAAQAPEAPPLEHYAEVWQRPIFSPTRTPEQASSDGDAASGDLELTGVIMVPGLEMAIVHDKTRDTDYRIVQGRPSGDGPALVELHPRSAVVEAAGARLNLQLVPGPAPAASAGQPPDATQPAAAAATQPASAMVTRREPEATPALMGQASMAARARQLKARVEADRRRAARQRGDGG